MQEARQAGQGAAVDRAARHQDREPREARDAGLNTLQLMAVDLCRYVPFQRLLNGLQ